ncbi:hypothetical protein [Nostoc sp.]|uniref:hypothetical protein n=1 Tax=Nostoc sp. TaxID=1180 RepID=UPI002FFB3549
MNEERDFNHLRTNQVQISQGIAMGFDQIERRLDHIREQLIEMKAYLIQNQGTVRGE